MNRNNSLEAGCTPSDSFENNEVDIGVQNCPKKKVRLLDQLYESTASLENPNKKKKLKVLKPRSQCSDRSAMSNSVNQSPTINSSSQENEVTNFEVNHETKEIVDVDKNCDTVNTTKTKTTETYPSKRTNMQLRSSRKISDDLHGETNAKSYKNSKKRKCCSSPDRESVSSKQSKTSKSTKGKENDAQVDFAVSLILCVSILVKFK